MRDTLTTLASDPRCRFAFVVLLACSFIFTKLGGTGLATWDDCFYAQKAKEIHTTGSWMTMHYAGDPAFENPPGFMWLVALSYDIWGTTEYAAIFPSALFGVLCIALVYRLAEKLFDPWTAFFSSLALSTTFYFTKYARHAMIDVTVSFFVTLAMLSLVLAVRRDARYFLLWGLALSATILLKSVLGALPLVITVVYLLMTARWKMLFNAWFLAGSLVILTVGCSWYIHQDMRFGSEFIGLHFGWLIVQRGFGSEGEPWYAHLSYLDDLLHYYWPWLPVFAWSLYMVIPRLLKKDDNAILLSTWIVVYLGVLSATQSRMLWYIMPIFPATAILCGHTMSGWLSDDGRIRAARFVIPAGIVLALVMIFTPLQLSSDRERDIRTIAPYVKQLALPNVEVAGFGYAFHSLNNPLLFYSDHAARPIYATIEELRARFADSAYVLCVVNAEKLDSVLALVQNVHVLRKTEGATLVSNRPFDVTNVSPW